MTPAQWRLHHAVTHIMLAALVAVWSLLGFGIYKWVRS